VTVATRQRLDPIENAPEPDERAAPERIERGTHRPFQRPRPHRDVQQVSFDSRATLHLSAQQFEVLANAER